MTTSNTAHGSVPPLQSVSAEDLDRLREFDTCILANAIERFQIRLRNEGYTGPGLQCLFEDLQPMLGYAVTGRVRSSNPPMKGGWYFERTDWWSAMVSAPEPRVAVLEDIETPPGRGSVAGEMHVQVLRKLGSVGLVTNGAVRDVPAVRELGFPLYAGSVSVSHSYYHIVDFGTPVDIFGLGIAPGDLLYGDRHGILSIPKQIVKELPEVAIRIQARERKIIDFCQSPEFSLEKLKNELKSLA